jgi:hypothetical protein
MSKFNPLTDLLPLSVHAPRFPSFAELVKEDAEAKPVEPEARKGLFETLIGNPEILIDDSIKHPHRYEAETTELLYALSSGRKKLSELTPAAQELLDHATLEYAQPYRERKVVPPPQRVKTAEDQDVAASTDSGFDIHGLGAYWWLK